jgi:AraC family transcriptional regulator of adaptative response/methylated-DNA-[protein]-cysteine methyltransferase
MTPQISDTSVPETLRFGYGDTALGTIIVAESGNGVVALFIGDDRAKLLGDTKDALPNVAFVLDQEGLAQTVARAAALVDAPHRGIDLALDMRGSPVEMAVWDALRAIPAGRDKACSASAA